jgi:hypothetical protein
MAAEPYTIRPVTDWDAGGGGADTVWQSLPELEISHFRPEGSDHRPRTRLKLGYTREGLAGIFRVADRYVRCVHTGFQAQVFKDSCVECFLQPDARGGYFNFEFNCGGSLRVAYITDPARVAGGFKAFTPLKAEEGRQVRIQTSLPARIDPEISGPVVWHLAFFIPFAVLEAYTGALHVQPGRTWRGNFFKCADESSHPHWASWAPLDARNFHSPSHFDMLRFA